MDACHCACMSVAHTWTLRGEPAAKGGICKHPDGCFVQRCSRVEFASTLMDALFRDAAIDRSRREPTTSVVSSSWVTKVAVDHGRWVTCISYRTRPIRSRARARQKLKDRVGNRNFRHKFGAKSRSCLHACVLKRM